MFSVVTGEPTAEELAALPESPDDLFYASELAGPETSIVYTRTAPAGSARAVGRIRPDDIPALAGRGDVTAYVCGSAGFCNTAGDLLVVRFVLSSRPAWLYAAGAA